MLHLGLGMGSSYLPKRKTLLCSFSSYLEPDVGTAGKAERMYCVVHLFLQIGALRIRNLQRMYLCVPVRISFPVLLGVFDGLALASDLLWAHQGLSVAFFSYW